jgi:hypothetical protein
MRHPVPAWVGLANRGVSAAANSLIGAPPRPPGAATKLEVM